MTAISILVEVSATINAIIISAESSQRLQLNCLIFPPFSLQLSSQIMKKTCSDLKSEPGFDLPMKIHVYMSDMFCAFEKSREIITLIGAAAEEEGHHEAEMGGTNGCETCTGDKNRSIFGRGKYKHSSNRAVSVSAAKS